MEFLVFVVAVDLSGEEAGAEVELGGGGNVLVACEGELEGQGGVCVFGEEGGVVGAEVEDGVVRARAEVWGAVAGDGRGCLAGKDKGGCEDGEECERKERKHGRWTRRAVGLRWCRRFVEVVREGLNIKLKI